MPRAFNTAAWYVKFAVNAHLTSSDTCRKRKVKCDEKLPICSQCARANRHCRASSTSIISSDALGGADTLADGGIARLFHSYIANVAPWYDLGDAARLFATLVPALALDEPLLFNAVIALAAMHSAQTGRGARKTAEAFHGRCVRRLIALDDGSTLLDNGVALAAACLLRSYEILDEDVDPNRHLQGAYSFASRASTLDGGLMAAGFWNYLREDITFSLFEECPLKLELGTGHAETANPLHSISFILGKLVNAAFGHAPASVFVELHEEAEQWYRAREEAHMPFSRICNDTFPQAWFLQDTYACCILATRGPTEVVALLRPPYSDSILPFDELLDAYASDICGISFTTKTPSVLVNSFGPISYCGKYIRPEAREELVRNLTACKKVIGWPVQRLVADLRRHWGGDETRARDS